jgi:hypothetical protein
MAQLVRVQRVTAVLPVLIVAALSLGRAHAHQVTSARVEPGVTVAAAGSSPDFVQGDFVQGDS